MGMGRFGGATVVLGHKQAKIHVPVQLVCRHGRERGPQREKIPVWNRQDVRCKEKGVQYTPLGLKDWVPFPDPNRTG